MREELTPQARHVDLKKRNTSCLISMAVVLSTFILGAYASDKSWHLGMGCLIALAALIDYIYLAVRLKNWMDIVAVFTGSWTFTVALASLRLCQYQKVWATGTWVCLGLAYAAFVTGDLLYYNLSARRKGGETWLARVAQRHPIRRERLFWIALSVSLISLICLTINALIRGYLPYFSESKTAYLDFYTKFHIFTVAGTAASGLCYYNIKRGSLSFFKKAVMWGCLIYLSLVMPILVVSRGTFLINAVYVTTVVFYLNKKKFVALFLCLVLMFGGYELGTRARKYTEEDNAALFSGTEYSVMIGHHKLFDAEFSSNVLFMYSYFTIGHDNLDMAVKNPTELSYGLRQLIPLSVVVRVPALHRALSHVKTYLINASLNTTDIVTFAYYDLREPGVALFSMVLGFAIAFLESLADRRKSAFRLIFLGYAMVAVMLSFFSAWVSNFALYLPAGTAFLMMLCAVEWKKNKGEVDPET